MENQLQYTLTPHSVTIIKGTEGKVFTSEHTLFDKIKEAIFNNNLVYLDEVAYGLEKVIKKAYVGFEVKEDVVFIDGEELPTALGRRLVNLADEGQPYDYVLNFWRLLNKNTSYQSIQTCYNFIEKNHLPFYNDGSGRVVAYKAVRDDFFDKYSGKIKYEIGSTVEMERRLINDDSRKLCATGMHIGSKNYAQTYGSGSTDRLLEVLIDPADVVSVPSTDGSEAKMRVCKLIVLREIPKNEPQDMSQVWRPSEDEEDDDVDDYDDDFDDDDEEYDDDDDY